MHKNHLANLKKTAHKALDKFLEEHRVSEVGEYAPFTKQDEEDFYALIERISEAKFVADADGDRPLEVKLVNRTRQESCPYFVEEYLYKMTTSKEVLSYMRSMQANARMACESLSFATYRLEHIEKEQKRDDGIEKDSD